MSLFTDLFGQLTNPPSGDGSAPAYSGVPIPGYPYHRIARDQFGHPVLLLGLRPGQRPTSSIIRLKNISVAPAVTCRLLDPLGAQSEGTFTILRVEAADAQLQRFFLEAAETLVHRVGENPTLPEVNTNLDQFIELFRSLSRTSSRTTTGLWGELFLITRARSPITMLEAWHPERMDPFDFSFQQQRVEVKATEGATRRHLFSAEQLDVSTGTEILVASILLRRIAMGLSLGTLVSQIRQIAGSRYSLLTRIDTIVAETLGDSLPEALERSYDETFAAASLRFYHAADVPALRPPFPEGVDDIRFSSNLSDASPIDPNIFEPASLFGAL